MVYITINAILYLGVLITYWIIRRKADVGFVLITLYTFVAFLGVLLYNKSPNDWEITLWPYLYLFSILILFFRPFFFDSDSLYERIYIRNYQILKIISTLYIISALIAIYYMFPQAIKNFQLANWGDLRHEIYSEGITLYSGQIERIAKIFTQYFYLAAVVILFYYLTLTNIKIVWIILLAIAVLVPTILTSALLASRGLLFGMSINLLAVYLIFRKEIPRKTKIYIWLIGILLLIVILSFSISVTKSRFGTDNQTASLLYYFGHSFMKFNYGVADSIKNYAGGLYFFEWFYDLLGLESTINYNILGTHFGTYFITFVGTLYLDFGPWGTLLIAIVVPWIISRCFRQKEMLDIADIYIYVFYLSYLLNGVFVVARGNALAWLVALIIYRLLKIKRLKFTATNNAAS